MPSLYGGASGIAAAVVHFVCQVLVVDDGEKKSDVKSSHLLLESSQPLA